MTKRLMTSRPASLLHLHSATSINQVHCILPIKSSLASWILRCECDAWRDDTTIDDKQACTIASAAFLSLQNLPRHLRRNVHSGDFRRKLCSSILLFVTGFANAANTC